MWEVSITTTEPIGPAVVNQLHLVQYANSMWVRKWLDECILHRTSGSDAALRAGNWSATSTTPRFLQVSKFVHNAPWSWPLLNAVTSEVLYTTKIPWVSGSVFGLWRLTLGCTKGKHFRYEISSSALPRPEATRQRPTISALQTTLMGNPRARQQILRLRALKRSTAVST